MKNIFGLFLLIVVLGWGEFAEAQQPKKVPRIGFLNGSSLSPILARYEAFRLGLRELGYVEGENIVIEQRFAEGKIDRLPELAAELVRLKVDVIVVVGTQETQTAEKATQTIPIVMVQVGDPVGSGLVASLANPGGNITGLSQMIPELTGKRLELLKEAFPKVVRVTVLYDPANRGNLLAVKEVEAAAGPLGLNVRAWEVRGSDDFDTAFSAMTRGRAAALMTMPNPLTGANIKRIADLAVKSRLPVMYHDKENVEAGGLMSYGVNLADLWRRAATYVDKILKGRKPADLPVEQPMKFEFVINLKAAKQIGVTIPPNVLVRADKVIR